MLYVELKDGTELQWHTGEKIRLLAENISDVVEVQADGHELEWVETHTKNIPLAVGSLSVHRWFGDHAKFIANCLPKKY